MAKKPQVKFQANVTLSAEFTDRNKAKEFIAEHLGSEHFSEANIESYEDDE